MDKPINNDQQKLGGNVTSEPFISTSLHQSIANNASWEGECATMEDNKQPHVHGQHHQIITQHDRNGSDIEIPIADQEKTSGSHLGSGDEKNMNVIDHEHQGEFTEPPRQSRKERFRRMVRKWKPALHLLIWMLVTTQVAGQFSSLLEILTEV